MMEGSSPVSSPLQSCLWFSASSYATSIEDLPFVTSLGAFWLSVQSSWSASTTRRTATLQRSRTTKCTRFSSPSVSPLPNHSTLSPSITWFTRQIFRSSRFWLMEGSFTAWFCFHSWSTTRQSMALSLMRICCWPVCSKPSNTWEFLHSLWPWARPRPSTLKLLRTQRPYSSIFGVSSCWARRGIIMRLLAFSWLSLELSLLYYRKREKMTLIAFTAFSVWPPIWWGRSYRRENDLKKDYIYSL